MGEWQPEPVAGDDKEVCRIPQTFSLLARRPTL
jgi:hypothetical protein